MSVTAPYAPPPAQPAKKKPGKVGIIIGIALLVLGPVIGTILIVTSAIGSSSGVARAPAFAADGNPNPVSLDAGVNMGIWTNPGDIVGGTCQILDPSGGNVAFSTSNVTNETMNNYQLAATFTPPVSGTYTVRCATTGTAFNFKIAPPMQVGGLVVGIVVGVLLIVVGILAGLVVLIVSLIRRSHWKSRYGPEALAAAQPYAQPEPAAWTPAPVPDQPTPVPPQAWPSASQLPTAPPVAQPTVPPAQPPVPPTWQPVAPPLAEPPSPAPFSQPPDVPPLGTPAIPLPESAPGVPPVPQPPTPSLDNPASPWAWRPPVPQVPVPQAEPPAPVPSETPTWAAPVPPEVPVPPEAPAPPAPVPPADAN